MDEPQKVDRGEMPDNGPESSRKSTPARPRHHVTRSISEVSSPSRLRPSARDERTTQTRPRPAATASRSSVDVSRPLQAAASGAPGGTQSVTTPGSTIPNPTSRASAVAAHFAANDGPPPSMPPNSDAHNTKAAAAAAAAAAGSNPATRESDGDAASRGSAAASAAMARVEGLKKSLSELEVSSAAMIRRLDSTYYSVLERLSMLQSTVLVIRELAVMSKRMDHAFQAESNEVVADVSSQLESFGEFEHHQNRIQALQGRISRGQEKIKALSQRVDAVGDRIDGWEKADMEWQERTRKRLKIIWFLIIMLAAAVLLLFVLVPPATEEGLPEPREAAASLGLLGAGRSGPSNRTGVNFKPSRTGSDDRLQVFDEL